MNSDQARKYIIQPALEAIGYYSPDAEELLILTMAQESKGGHYIHQLGGGPALGVFQMEPRSYQDLEDWLKNRRPKIWEKVQDVVIPNPGKGDNYVAWIYRKFYLKLFDPCIPEMMIWHDRFAAAMARCYYLRVPKPLPKADDIEGLAKYYKKYWNTHLGAATVEEAISNYKKYVQ